MQDIRKSPEYQQWKREVRRRDGNACRVCGVHLNLHIHHIKPLEKYPDFATEIDNGITLCGNCHALLKGKEESTNLQTIIEAASKKPDTRTTNQLKQLNDKLYAYLEPLLKSSDPNTRNAAFYQLFVQLQLYPDSLPQFLPLIQYLLDTDNRPTGEFRTDGQFTKQIAVEFLKGSASRAAAQVLTTYENQKQKAEAERLKELYLRAEQGEAIAQLLIGKRYQDGESVVQNDEEALKWFQKAAEQGNASAQYNLSRMYAKGMGVPQNDEEAVKWLQKAAETGHPVAQKKLVKQH